MSYTLETAIKEICYKLDDNFFDRYVDAGAVVSGYYSGRAKNNLYQAIDDIARTSVQVYKGAQIKQDVPFASLTEIYGLLSTYTATIGTLSTTVSLLPTGPLTSFSDIIGLTIREDETSISLKQVSRDYIDSGLLGYMYENDICYTYLGSAIKFLNVPSISRKVTIEYLSGITRISDSTAASSQDLLLLVSMRVVDMAIDLAVMRIKSIERQQ